MRRRWGGIVMVVVAFGVTSAVDAIVIRHDRDDARHVKLAERYPAACHLQPDGEGVLVASRWILTAAHVARSLPAGAAVVCGGVEYGIDDFELHPGSADRKYDLALLKLKRAVEGISPVAVYAQRDEAGEMVTFVGRGDTGDGRRGPSLGPAQVRPRRAATNRVDRVDDHFLAFTFDAPGSDAVTDLEGVSGPGDSGGPALLERDGKLWVIGISHASTNEPGQRPGTYGTGELYVRVSSHAEWILRTVAEREPRD